MPEDKVQEFSYVMTANAACFFFHRLLLLIPACLLVRASKNSPDYNIPIAIVRLPFSSSFYGFMMEKCLLHSDCVPLGKLSPGNTHRWY